MWGWGQETQPVDALCVHCILVLLHRKGWSPPFSQRLVTYCAHCCCFVLSLRRSSACDPHGEVWDVAGLYVADGSAFPTPSGVNPMVTIYAVSYLTAQGIADRWKGSSSAQASPAQGLNKA